MNKQIIFSLLFLATAPIHGMKRSLNTCTTIFDNPGAMTFCNDDLMPQITHRICMNHNYLLCDVITTIRALSCTNKFLRDYYTRKENQQNTIKDCSQYRKSNDKDMAHRFKYRQIEQEIEYFTDIAFNQEKQFSEDDLKKSWYLNITTTIWNNFLRQFLQQSLLQVALNHSNAEKVMAIIDNAKKLDFYYNDKQNLLSGIAQKRNQMIDISCSILYIDFINDEEHDNLLEIAKRLLQKGIIPDGRESDTQNTPLIYAVKYKDKELTQLLLESGADPYAELYDMYKAKMVTAFDFEEEKGWLQNIIDDVKTAQSQIDQSVAK